MKIAFIGSVGVPNLYGGFEIFLESCCPIFAQHFEKVFVTCDRSRYSERAPFWMGVCRVFVPVRANGGQSVIHDLFAYMAVFWRVKVIVVLGVSGGMFFPLFRLMCLVTGKKLIVNVDGIESRRSKFSVFKQRFLYFSDRLAQRFSHRVVIDNEALRQHLDPYVQQNAVLITYPGDHVLRGSRNQNSRRSNSHYLTICRIEPENQCHLLLESFARTGSGTYVFLGNWDASEYGRRLRSQYRDVPGLEMRDPVYDKNVLADLRENCDCYLHGHSVGGTNPSLVEMLFYECKILAFDCIFNRNTAGDTIGYFKSSDELVFHLKNIGNVQRTNRSSIRHLYTRERICNDYIHLIKEITRDHVNG